MRVELDAGTVPDAVREETQLPPGRFDGIEELQSARGGVSRVGKRRFPALLLLTADEGEVAVADEDLSADLNTFRSGE